MEKALIKLESSSTAIGLMKTPEFTSRTLTYQEEFQVLLYTDGLLELLKDKSLDGKFNQISSAFLDHEVTIFSWLENLVKKESNFPDDISIVEIKNLPKY